MWLRAKIRHYQFLYICFRLSVYVCLLHATSVFERIMLLPAQASVQLPSAHLLLSWRHSAAPEAVLCLQPALPAVPAASAVSAGPARPIVWQQGRSESQDLHGGRTPAIVNHMSVSVRSDVPMCVCACVSMCVHDKQCERDVQAVALCMLCNRKCLNCV